MKVAPSGRGGVNCRCQIEKIEPEKNTKKHTSVKEEHMPEKCPHFQNLGFYTANRRMGTWKRVAPVGKGKTKSKPKHQFFSSIWVFKGLYPKNQPAKRPNDQNICWICGYLTTKKTNDTNVPGDPAVTNVWLKTTWAWSISYRRMHSCGQLIIIP